MMSPAGHNGRTVLISPVPAGGPGHTVRVRDPWSLSVQAVSPFNPQLTCVGPPPPTPVGFRLSIGVTVMLTIALAEALLGVAQVSV
jgi:hypothetical protein